MDAKVCFKVWKVVMAVAVLGAVANQGASPQAPSCTSFAPSVTARISTVGNAASVNPDRACVAPGGTMNWTATDGETWSTDFTNDAHSPFAPGQTHHAGKVGMPGGGRVKKCSTSDSTFDSAAGGCVHKYKATHVKGGKTSIIDPDVIVKPGS